MGEESGHPTKYMSDRIVILFLISYFLFILSEPRRRIRDKFSHMPMASQEEQFYIHMRPVSGSVRGNITTMHVDASHHWMIDKRLKFSGKPHKWKTIYNH